MSHSGQSRQDSRETLATLAGDTGGRSFFDTGDFGKIFQSVQNDTSGYYLVGSVAILVPAISLWLFRRESNR